MSKLRHAIDLAGQESRLYKRVSRKTVSLLLSEIENYMSESAYVLEMLDEYFDDYADADFGQDGYIPNTEMQHKARIEEALKLV